MVVAAMVGVGVAEHLTEPALHLAAVELGADGQTQDIEGPGHRIAQGGMPARGVDLRGQPVEQGGTERAAPGGGPLEELAHRWTHRPRELAHRVDSTEHPLGRRCVGSFLVEPQATSPVDEVERRGVQTDPIHLEPVTQAGLGNLHPGGHLADEAGQIGPQLLVESGHATGHDDGQQKAAGTRRRIDGQAGVAHGDAAGRGHTSGVVDLQLRQDHGVTVAGSASEPEAGLSKRRQPVESDQGTDEVAEGLGVLDDRLVVGIAVAEPLGEVFGPSDQVFPVGRVEAER